ncbi:glycosyltransferase [Xanthomonas albilineans]|uniref:glycosyltransferase n=1 Tax=Xanthomonas albilineans TaxID=29447 RepID=UPI0005F3341F|nr:glycosyltransferase [Xanthomonas albilineans]
MSLPIVLVPVGVDDVALDACLGALEANTPAGTRVWLADDAQAGPRGVRVIEAWLARTRLQADYTRRACMLGEVAHLDEMLRACADADVAVLAADAQPLPGWLQHLSACLARDAAIASGTPWSNAGETCAWPRLGEINPLPEDPERLARACAALPPLHPELPAAVCHAVVLRGAALQRVGGLDASSYGSWYAALIDLSLRMAGLGWRNVLCETAHVARRAEGCAADGDMEALATRWPAWHARLAGFLMHDPLRACRDALRRGYDTLSPLDPQGMLFDV